MTVTSELRRTSLAGRVLTWLLVLVVAAVLVAAAVVSGRPQVVVAAVAGLVVAWLVVRFFRLVRRRPLVAFALLAVGLGVAAVTLFGLTISPNPSTNAPPGSVTGPVSVPYTAIGQLSGATISLREQITLDKDALDAVQRMLGPLPTGDGADQVRAPDGWTAGQPIDGFPSFTRTRTVNPEDDTLVSSRLWFPIDLGNLRILSKDLPMYPRAGSRMELATPKGAVGATYPDAAQTANDPRPGGGEVTTIAVDPGVRDISLAVLKGPLQNPAGRQVYDAFTWGPLPWAVGAFFALLASLAGDKLKQWLGLAARRVVRRGPVPQQT